MKKIKKIFFKTNLSDKSIKDDPINKNIENIEKDKKNLNDSISSPKEINNEGRNLNQNQNSKQENFNIGEKPENNDNIPKIKIKDKNSQNCKLKKS